MRFQTTPGELLKGLQAVSRAISSRPSVPVLSYALLESSGKTLTITGFDLNIGVTTTIEVVGGVAGRMCVPPKILQGLLKTLPNAPISIEFDGTECKIEGLSGTYSIHAMEGDDFPALPEIPRERVSVDPSAFLSCLSLVEFSMSVDETKQVLAGVHLKLSQNSLEAASTDGHRLTVAREVVEYSGDPVECNVPAVTVKQLVAALKKADSLTIQLDSNHVCFEVDDTVITSRLNSGQYPQYSALIPNKFERTLCFESDSLTGALNRAAVIASQKNNIIRLNLDRKSQETVISVEAQDVGGLSEKVGCSLQGKSLECAFNVKYLQQSINALATDEVELQMNGATQPAVIRPVDGGDALCLVMPVQVRA